MSMTRWFVITLILKAIAVGSAGAQTCKEGIPKTTPDNAFTIHDDGTVTHDKTGLMWMRCDLGQTWDGAGCSGEAQSYDWQNALDTAELSTFAGYSDWRVPNKNELASIVERACVSPSVNTMAYPNVAWIENLWSSSPYAGSDIEVWYMDSIGSFSRIFNGYDGNHVRLVRGGQ